MNMKNNNYEKEYRHEAVWNWVKMEYKKHNSVLLYKYCILWNMLHTYKVV